MRQSASSPPRSCRLDAEVMHKIGSRTVERRYEIYLCLYQAVTGR